MNSTLVEYVNGIEVIRHLIKEVLLIVNLQVQLTSSMTVLWHGGSRVGLWSAVIQAVMPTTLLGNASDWRMAYMTGTLPLSDFITCIILPIGFIAPLMRVGKYSEQFNMVKACLDQIRDFIEKPELKRPAKKCCTG